MARISGSAGDEVWKIARLKLREQLTAVLILTLEKRPQNTLDFTKNMM